MASFLINTKAEFFKSRKTAAYFIALAAGFFVPLINTLSYVFKPNFFVTDFKDDPWHHHINNCWQPASAFLMPMFIILLTSLMVQIEYRNNTWKQVYTSPRSYADVFFSKFVIIQVLILGSFALFDISIIASGYISNAINSGYTFFDHAIPWNDMLDITAKMYVSILGMTAIQYWISLRLKNYIAPLAVGMALLITGLIAMKWDKIIYYPYAYSAMTFFKRGEHLHRSYSYIWFVGILLLAFWDTVRRKERG